MKTFACLLLIAGAVLAETAKPFPAHWGEPPKLQTRDYRELPGGFGHGSSTLAAWIETNLAKDAAGSTTKAPTATSLFTCDFDSLPAGPLPDTFMVLQGEFAVKDQGTNKVMELPGAPLDSYAVLFGPVTNAGVAVAAEIFGTAKGRRQPTFGVGLGGAAGYKLQISPAKKLAELMLDTQVVASAPFEWASGSWTSCRLEIVSTGKNEWRVSAKAWNAARPEPKDWLITHIAKEEPTPGQASALGSPFSGTPVWYDNLRVTAAQSKSEQLMK